MQRRKFVIGAGALTAGAAAAVGTGAFTSVTASRDIDVEVADDASAYLRLEGKDSHYVTGDGDGGTLSIDISSDNETDAGGQGVNPDAVTEFGTLFTVENQGTQTVEVSVDLDADDPVMFTVGNDESLNEGINLDAGEHEDVGLTVDTTGDVDLDEDLVESVTITAMEN